MLRVPVLLLILASSAIAQTPPPKVEPAKPFNIDDWTPRPAAGKNSEPWERMKDPEWNEDRFRKMDTGPFQDATFKFPLGTTQELVYKGTAVKLDNATVLFDRSTMRLAAAWTGGYLYHSDRRFGLLNTPLPAPNTKTILALPSSPGWADAEGKFPHVPKATAPLAPTHAKYRGLYVHGDRVVFSYTVSGVGVLDTAKAVTAPGKTGIVRTLLIDPHKEILTLKVDPARNSAFPANDERRSFFLAYGDQIPAEADDPAALTKPGPARWKTIETKLERGSEDGPFAIDTLTIPYKNEYNALFFCTGLDFLPDGRIAMCTCHGDVWLVKVDEKAGTVQWQRHATGLYHPLGLKVIDGQVVVLERGQLTRLHDNNADGEADFYECISNQWDTGSGEHAYDTCLETDADGNFYFFKTGDPDLPTGGCLLKVSKDGSKTEVFATGFRHPIGMGMSPDGKILTGADQEGNWMPATRIDQYKKGGFYGDMRAAHRDPLPTTYDPPLCWLPREVDNSAGGEVWVPEGKFGPLGGLPLHFSYGRCRAYVMLRQELPDGTLQGGAAPLPMQFLSGSCRGRFNPTDGALYVCGLNGWQTSAKADGSLQRVRYTGKALSTVVKSEVTATGVKLTFSQPLDPATAENPANYKAAWWNYRWSGDYGSKRWKVSNPNVEGQDEFAFATAKLVDPSTVELTVSGGVKPVMQFQVGYNVKAKSDDVMTGSVFLTVHGMAK